jgi:hypothetical protein
MIFSLMYFPLDGKVPKDQVPHNVLYAQSSRNIAFIPAVTTIHLIAYFLLLPSKESTKENSPLHKKSLFSTLRFIAQPKPFRGPHSANIIKLINKSYSFISSLVGCLHWPSLKLAA